MRRRAQLGWLPIPALLAIAAPAWAQPDAPVLWKPVPMAMLRVDDRAPKLWQIYGAEKRKHALLVQIGGRFLLLDVEAKRVYELAPRTLTRKDDTLEWKDPGAASDSSNRVPTAANAATAERPASAAQSASPPAEPARATAERATPDKAILPSAEWTMRDVGRMLRIRLRLTAEGREFDIQIPIQPDLRQFY